MTIIEKMMSECVRLEKSSSQSDGVFGHINSWADGDGFRAAVILQKTQQVTTAEQPDLHDEYTVVVPAGTTLSHHDVFRRVSDGAIFRVTGDTRDTQAPEMSTVQIAKTTAERITNDGEYTQRTE